MPDGTEWEVSAPRTGVFLTRDGITGMDDPQWDIFTSDSPVLHGSRFHGYRAPEREVVLPIYLYHDGGSAAWTARYRAFKAWLSPRHVIQWRVEHPESGEGRTLHMRYVDSGNPTATLDHRQRGWKLMNLHFVADERPFWEGDAISRSWRQAEPVDFFDPDGSPPFHVSQSALLGEATVHNPSDEPVWPVWTADDGDFDSVTVGVDGRVVQAPIEVRQPQPVDVAVNGDGSSTDGRSVVGENLARNPRGRNNERQTLVQNLVTNPRGRPTDTEAEVDPLAPVGWDGPGIWWSAEHDAVHVPAGASVNLPTEALDQTSTLAVFDAETENASYHTVTAPVTLPPADEDRYVRVMVTPGAYDGPYVDGDADPELETVVAWTGEPHESATEVTALHPAGWSEGVRYSEDEDAVYVPEGVAAEPGSEPAEGGTLVVRDLTAGTITRQPINGTPRLPAASHGRYVRVMTTTQALYRGAYIDAHTGHADDEDLTVEWAGDEGESGFQLTAPRPEHWDGEGIYYSQSRQAVFVPALVEVGVQATGAGELVVDAPGGVYRTPFEGVIPAATSDRYLKFEVWQPTGEPLVLTLDSRPGPRGKSAYLNEQRRTPDLTRREWAPIPPGEAVPVTLEMVGDGRVTCTITPLYSEAY